MGLHLELGGERRIIPSPRVADSLPEALSHGTFDAAVFALKSFDTASALESMHPYADRLPPILCLQNGVENEAVIAGLLGKDRVIAGTVTSAVGRRAAGDIHLEKLRGVGIAAGNPLSSDLVSTFSACGLNARLIPSAEGMKWSKMLTNLLSNATSAILGMTPAEVFGDPGLFRLEAAQLQEALHVMRRLKIPVVDLPGTPVRMLVFAIQKLPLGLAMPLLKRAVGGGRGAKMPSFYIDLHSGRGRSEVDYLNGAVVRFGERFGYTASVNRLLTETLLGLISGEIPVDRYLRQPEKLLSAWKKT